MHNAHTGHPNCQDTQIVVLFVMQQWPIFLSWCCLHCFS